MHLQRLYRIDSLLTFTSWSHCACKCKDATSGTGRPLEYSLDNQPCFSSLLLSHLISSHLICLAFLPYGSFRACLARYLDHPVSMRRAPAAKHQDTLPWLVHCIALQSTLHSRSQSTRALTLSFVSASLCCTVNSYTCGCFILAPYQG